MQEKALMRTKASEIARFERESSNAGFSIPPLDVQKKDASPEQVRQTLNRFKALSKPEGPFREFVIYRDNYGPEGTGEGFSKILRIDTSENIRDFTISKVIASSPHSDSFIIQLVVGQPIIANSENLLYSSPHEAFVPVISGVAYTQGCTVRKNAVVEWVYGHPASAVEGKGRYVSFNSKSISNEVNHLDLSITQPIRIPPGLFEWPATLMLDGDKILKQAFDKVISEKELKKLFKDLFSGILQLGKNGDFYIEWAMTYVNQEGQRFLLQISEFERKLAGLPTKLHYECVDALRHSAVRGNEELRKIYQDALLDPRTIAAGFDVSGRMNKEFDTIIWKPHSKTLDELKNRKERYLLTFERREVGINHIRYYIPTGNIQGIVELNKSNVVSSLLTTKDCNHTFRTHFDGFCAKHGIPGLGSTTTMAKRLYAQFPEKFSGYKGKQRLLITGKFVLEVDEQVPFGVLKVLEVTSVESLAR